MSASYPFLELEALVDSWGLRFIAGRELTPYWSRIAKGVRNSCPPAELWINLRRPLQIVDAVRASGDFGPVALLSTYRSPAYNAAVGGVPASFHTQCLAVDCNFARGTPSMWAACARLVMMRMQCPGGIGTYSSRGFVHVDVRGSWAYWFKR
jgi:N-acetylmuramoyl-L-alanine amidase